MLLLNVSGLSKFYGIHHVFQDVSFKVSSHDRIGIVGVNGAGKTTLFRLLSSNEECNAGIISRGKEVKIAYMEQHSDYTSNKSAIQEVLDVFSQLKILEDQIEMITKQLQNSANDLLIKKHSAMSEQFINLGGLTYKSRARSTLLGLGFSENELDLPLCHLSGGQRTRVLLAKILLSGSDLLLLDEPTNHLDIQAVQWLEEFLIGYKGAVLVISHDRFFLDRICTKIFEMVNGHLDIYNGNYTDYRKQKAVRQLSLEREYTRKQQEIKRIEGIIEQQRRFNQERNYITIKSKQKQIDKISSELVAPEQDPQEIHFTFKSCGDCANEVLVAEHISKEFKGTILFRDINMFIKRKDRIFLIGPNGCGKTTLLRILLSMEPATVGQIIIGSRVKVGYYDQTQSDLTMEKTIFDEISDTYPSMDNTSVRSALGAFLFKGDDVYKKISELSGGERARVSLVKLILSQANFLILDEPTNHLDIESKEILENALEKYDGTLLMVSHDRYFIQKFANKIYEIKDKKIICYEGDYSYYLEKSAQTQIVNVKKKKPGDNSYLMKKAQQAENRRRQTSIKRIEKEIEKAEADLSVLQEDLEKPEVAGNYVILIEKTNQISALIEQIDALYEEWENMSVE